MTAFAAAAAALAGDPNLGVPATYTRAAGGEPVAVRVILSAPEMAAGRQGQVIAAAVTAMLPAAALPGAAPARGDTLAVAGTPWRVEQRDLDPRGAAWTLTLSR